MSSKIINGNCLTVLPQLEEESIHCCVTSPPYWGLRDYGTGTWVDGNSECNHSVGDQIKDKKRGCPIPNGIRPGVNAYKCLKCGAKRIDEQIGIEETPEEYVNNLVNVFREVKRVLRNDGTLWLNLGDSYSSIIKGSGGPSEKQLSNFGSRYSKMKLNPGLPQKNLVGIPWRVAFALQNDGWILRSDIIWNKINPMPESVEDRPTRSHEYIFLFSKSSNYFYDHEAIKEELSSDIEVYIRSGENKRRRNGKLDTVGGTPIGKRSFEKVPTGKNKRTVWEVPNEPNKRAHFATFPTALVEPCIMAGTSWRGICSVCEKQYIRVMKDKECIYKEIPYITSYTSDWISDCKCNGEIMSATVLDPFAGSGTVGEVSESLGRRSILIELNSKYIDLIKLRTMQRNLFTI